MPDGLVDLYGGELLPGPRVLEYDGLRDHCIVIIYFDSECLCLCRAVREGDRLFAGLCIFRGEHISVSGLGCESAGCRVLPVVDTHLAACFCGEADDKR